MRLPKEIKEPKGAHVACHPSFIAPFPLLRLDAAKAITKYHQIVALLVFSANEIASSSTRPSGAF
jgi:hypothetical protein